MSKDQKRVVYKRIQSEIFDFVEMLNMENIPEAHLKIEREEGGYDIVEAEKTGKYKYSVRRTNRLGNEFEFDLHLTEFGGINYFMGELKNNIAVGKMSEKDFFKTLEDEDFFKTLEDEDFRKSFLSEMARNAFRNAKYEMIMDKPILNYLRGFSKR
jgi:hypothetical protein